jgi:hypothetical protein
MQTISSPTLFDVPMGQKLHVRSNDLFTAAVLPRHSDQDMMMNVLNSAVPTNTYTSLNMPNSESVCIVKPYNNTPINLETSYTPASSGMRSAMNYGRLNNGMMRTMYTDPTPTVATQSFMDKIKEWWAKVPSWARWLGLAVIVVLISMMIYMLWRKYGMGAKSYIPKFQNPIRTGLSFF